MGGKFRVKLDPGVCILDVLARPEVVDLLADADSIRLFPGVPLRGGSLMEYDNWTMEALLRLAEEHRVFIEGALREAAARASKEGAK